MKRIGTYVIALMAAATIANSQPRPQHHPPGPPPQRDERAVADFLQLTEAQTIAWESARDEFESATKATRDAGHAKQEELDALMESKSNDATRIGTLMIALRDTHDAMKAAHQALDTKLESVLTAEQKVKFEAMRAMRPQGPPR